MNQVIRERLEKAFAALARQLFHHRLKTLFLTFSLIAGLTAFIPNTTIDTSAVALLRETDPARIQYNEFQEQFGDKDMVLIAVTAPKIFDRDFLSRLKAFHRDIETQVPYLKKVNSLINARHTYGKEDALVVEDLLEYWPETSQDLEALGKTVASIPFYKNNLISDNQRVTTLILETQAIINEYPGAASPDFGRPDLSDAGYKEVTDGDPPGGEDILEGFDEPLMGETDQKIRYFGEKENQQVVAAVNALVAKYHGPEFSIALAGDPVVLDVYNRAMEKDIVMVVVLSLITIAIFLALLFQRVSWVLLPEIIIVSAVLCLFQPPTGEAI